LDPTHHPKQINVVHTLLPGAWSRIYSTSRCSIRSTSGCLYNQRTSVQSIQYAVDLADEARDTALSRTAGYQQAIHDYHSRRVHTRSFSKGDLLLRLKQKRPSQTRIPMGRTLHRQVIPGGAYRINKTTTGFVESNPWNVMQLR
jgi:hypothetical protein